MLPDATRPGTAQAGGTASIGQQLDKARLQAADLLARPCYEVHAPLGLLSVGMHGRVYARSRAFSEPAPGGELLRPGGDVRPRRRSEELMRETLSHGGAQPGVPTPAALPPGLHRLDRFIQEDATQGRRHTWAGALTHRTAVMRRLSDFTGASTATDVQGLLTVAALASTGLPASATPQVLERLRQRWWWNGAWLEPLDRIDRQALRLAETLARSEIGLETLRTISDGHAVPDAAMRIHLQAADFIRTHPVQAEDARHPAHAAWHASAAWYRGAQLSPAQKQALFDWSLGIADDDADHTRLRMQAVLHKFKHKTVHRWGSADSIRNGLPRLFGKRQGPLRAAMLNDPAGLPGSDATVQRDHMQELVRKLVAGLAVLSRIRLVDGHVYGVGTRQLFRAAGTVATLGGACGTVEIDAAAQQGGESVFELSRSQDGIRIFIGTDMRRMQQLRVNAAVGWHLQAPGLKLRAGASVSATPIHHESRRPEGLVIRVARRASTDGTGFDDPTMYRKALELIDHLFDGVAGDTPEQDWRHLAERYYDEPDLSFNWFSAHASACSGSVQASAGLAADVLHCTVGPEVSVQGNLHYRGRHEQHESGRRRVLERQHAAGHEIKSVASTGLRYRGGIVNGEIDMLPDDRTTAEPVGMPYGPPVTPAMPSLPVAPPPPAPAGHVTAPQVGSSAMSRINITMSTLNLPLHADHRNHMRAGKLRLVQEHGAIDASASIFDVEYQDLEDWARALRRELRGWIASFEAEERRKGDAGAARQAQARISAFVRAVRRNQRDFDGYLLRYQMRADVADRINLNRAIVDSLGDLVDAALREQMEAQNEALLQDRDSWIEAELKVRQSASAFRRAGIDFGAKLQRRLQLQSERDWLQLKVPQQALRDRQAQDRRAG
ncbi:hypothetical protein GT347_13345 [Xylophilus rhododendri]|uniref:Uncharacterized protein n=1 Tax=Xylophilus rhododendri TaxID=2697032 RepID=A0A857J800_9BURK|nr:hypothetical protein [Xylophilus rhododendri]QHI98888.1 hypothetical protein GT347_13345 [Xylophilus rhododendri]